MKCGFRIGDEVLSSDATIGEFFDRLRDGIFPGATPPAFEAFREQAEAREHAGRDHFGLGYLSRDNLAESLEEGSDFLIYLILDTLRHRREAGRDDDMDLTLQAAKLVYEASTTVRQLMGKRRGFP